MQRIANRKADGGSSKGWFVSLCCGKGLTNRESAWRLLSAVITRRNEYSPMRRDDKKGDTKQQKRGNDFSSFQFFGRSVNSIGEGTRMKTVLTGSTKRTALFLSCLTASVRIRNF